MQATHPSSFQKWSCVIGSDKALYHESGDGGGAIYAPVTCKLDYEGQIFMIMVYSLTPV